MSSYIIWILLLSIWNILLFYGNRLGISVILFMIPLLIFIYIFLKKNDKIQNKKGLLFLIPIVLLSLTFTLFDNELFTFLNCIVITLLFGVMYVFTIKPVDRLMDLVDKTITLLISPISYIGKFFRVSTSKISDKLKVSPKAKKVLLSILIVLPIVVVIVALLSSADMIFGNIFENIFGGIRDFLEDILFDDFVGRIITFIIVFFAIGTSMMYLLYEYPRKDEKTIVKENKTRDVFTLKLLVSVLNVIYIIFDVIQIKSLMLHSVSSGINYAEYARQGFFELMFVSIINIAIILISKKFETKDNKKDFNYINIMNVLMIVLTIIIIVSSFLRMNLYESAYGYTTLRLLVYVTLMTETILMIPTVMYIFNSNVNIFKCYLYIILTAYVVTNFMNIDYMIARRNVNRYYVNDRIDVEYLKNYRYDNIPILLELYHKTEDETVKVELKEYFDIMKVREGNESIFEYNISRNKAYNMLEKEEDLFN